MNARKLPSRYLENLKKHQEQQAIKNQNTKDNETNQSGRLTNDQTPKELINVKVQDSEQQNGQQHNKFNKNDEISKQTKVQEINSVSQQKPKQTLSLLKDLRTSSVSNEMSGVSTNSTNANISASLSPHTQNGNFSSDNMSPLYQSSPIYQPNELRQMSPTYRISQSQESLLTQENVAHLSSGLAETSKPKIDYSRYMELEQEAQKYKNIPATSFFVINKNEFMFDEYSSDPRRHLTRELTNEDLERIQIYFDIGQSNNQNDQNQDQSEIPVYNSSTLPAEQQHASQQQQVPQQLQNNQPRTTNNQRSSKEISQPLEEDQIDRIPKYILKKSYFSKQKEKQKAGLKKREVKSLEKTEAVIQKIENQQEESCCNANEQEISQKEQPNRAQHSITGLDYLDEIIQGAPMKIEQKLAKYPECIICLCKFKPDQEIRMLSRCKHIFHIDCIDSWLQINGVCPIDKQRVFRKIIDTQLVSNSSIQHHHYMRSLSYQHSNQRQDNNNSLL
eukprot:403358831